jgi:hypothetical protein
MVTWNHIWRRKRNGVTHRSQQIQTWTARIGQWWCEVVDQSVSRSSKYRAGRYRWRVGKASARALKAEKSGWSPSREIAQFACQRAVTGMQEAKGEWYWRHVYPSIWMLSRGDHMLARGVYAWVERLAGETGEEEWEWTIITKHGAQTLHPYTPEPSLAAAKEAAEAAIVDIADAYVANTDDASDRWGDLPLPESVPARGRRPAPAAVPPLAVGDVIAFALCSGAGLIRYTVIKSGPTHDPYDIVVTYRGGPPARFPKLQRKLIDIITLDQQFRIVGRPGKFMFGADLQLINAADATEVPRSTDLPLPESLDALLNGRAA